MSGLFILLFFLMAFILIFIGKTCIVVPEDKRIVVTRLGKFRFVGGPGFFIVLPFFDKVERLSLGQSGEYVGDALGRFGNSVVPIHFRTALRREDKIIISSFAPIANPAPHNSSCTVVVEADRELRKGTV